MSRTNQTSSSNFAHTLTHQIVRGGTIVTFFSLLAAPVGYVLKMILSRSLSIEEFGLYYAVLSLFVIFSSLNDLGFGYSLRYLVPKFLKKNDLRSTWNAYKYDQIIEVSTALLISSLLVIGSNILATYYFKSPLAVTLILAFIPYFLAESYIAATESFFVGLQQEKFYSSVKFTKLAFTAILVTGAWLLGHKSATLFAILWSTGHIAATALYTIFMFKKNYSIRQKVTWDKKLFKTMRRYALPMMLMSSLGVITTAIDNVALVFLRNVSQVGIYNIVLPLVIISPILLSPVNSLLLPLISKNEDNSAVLRQIIEASLRVIPYVSVYFGFFIFLFSDSIIQTIFGSKWMELASMPLKIATLGYIFLPISSLYSTFASGLGMVAEKTKLGIATTILKIILTLTSVYWFGLNGAIMTNIVLLLFTVRVMHYYVGRRVMFAIPWKVYTKLIAALLIGYALTNFLNVNPQGAMELLVVGVVYTIIYVIIGLVFQVIDKQQLQLIVDNRSKFIKENIK